MQNSQPLNTSIADMPELNTSTPFPNPNHQSADQKAHIGISDESANRIQEAADEAFADEALTARQQWTAAKLSTAYATIGIFVANSDVYDGLILMQNAEKRAEEVIRAARHNKAVYGWIEKIVNGSDLSAAIVGHAMMFFAIMAHHGRMKMPENILMAFGYHESQILTPPPGMNEDGSPGGNFGGFSA